MNNKGKLVYLATPYTHEDKAVEALRFRQVTEVSGLLVRNGVANVSPITQSHEQHIYVPNLPTTWDYWKSVDEIILSRCDEIYVLCIEGWDKSVGVTAEIEIAKSLKMPVKYIMYSMEDCSVYSLSEKEARDLYA